MRTVCLAVVLAVALGACSTDPRGTRLTIRTREFLAPGLACELVAPTPVRILRDGDRVVFIDVATGQPRTMIWPFGFAAWLEFGTAVLYASDGSVVGREGDLLNTIGGAADEAGFQVCAVGARTYP